MLVTFKTKAYSDITMFGEAAITLLKKMGHSGTVPGAILAEDVSTALNRLTSAINSEKALTNEPDNDPDHIVVTLAQRSLPLINLLEAALKAECSVMWE